MPQVLTKAHSELYKVVDLTYRSKSVSTDAKRMEFLFELYEKYNQGLYFQVKESSKKKRPVS